MKIGILGSGNVGGTLGELWAARGHEVLFGRRDPAAPARTSVPSASIREAAQFAQVLVLATPWRAAQKTLAACGDLTGKILLDCTNPLEEDLSGLTLGHHTSGGEQVAHWSNGARVVKCFNALGAQNFARPSFDGQAASMFFCGDDRGVKDVVSKLGHELGFDMVDCGPLSRARLLEPLALLWISLAYKEGLGPRIGFKLLRG
ncbi:MAG: NADPH-dependent F420 reductase [Planctomycetes bacterium]|nr:NADPH-dependent F420 reductase [Planctomycetota bacterium]